MHYYALACDYDGTLAHNGFVSKDTLLAIDRLRATGRKIVLVTGRILSDLQEAFPEWIRFEYIVAENGAVIHDVKSRETRILADPPPESFIEELRKHRINPLGVGNVIAATWEPNEKAVLEVIHDMGLELHVIFNKGAVMVLPSGVNKASGLKAALKAMGLSPHNVVGVGDAENDHAFLQFCECAAAVANGLPSVKQKADLVLSKERGEGVVELIERIIATDLSELRLARHEIPLGTGLDGREVRMRPFGENVLVCGSSAGGKSTLATALLESLAARDYQYFVVDPEGDYEEMEKAVVLGSAKAPLVIEEAIAVAREPLQQCVANLLGIPLPDRPQFFARLLADLAKLRVQTGRPHWLVFDEAHHLLPSTKPLASSFSLESLASTLMITVHPEHVAREVLETVDLVVAMGEHPRKALAEFADARGLSVPSIPHRKPEAGEAIAWRPRTDEPPLWFKSIQPRAERQRHHRKYAEGELGEDNSFYFKGKNGKLNLRAQNLIVFKQLAEGIDDETWLHHLRRGEYSRWFRKTIKDEDLAEDADKAEKDKNLSAAESRRRILAAIDQRYTKPA
jgi:hydroxymethylpyrimidine pyrophosphatase-like HAD family hydrolase